jgi:dihydroflavonol-4-reductase
VGLPRTLVVGVVVGDTLSVTAVFVTGGTGVVGRPIVARLVAKGRHVVALARTEVAGRDLVALGAQPAPAELLREDSLEAAMDGCEVVYHVAGVNRMCARDPSEMYRVNVLGSLAVVNAARRAGVRRVVYTSSAAALGERAGTVGTESSEHRGWFLTHYERSKFEAEKAVMRAASSAGPEIVCVNPSSVQGPGRAGGTTKLLRAFLNRRLPVYLDTRISLVDVDDCAAGHLLAEERGRPGERYVLNGATLEVADALALLGRLTGVEVRAKPLPKGLALAGAALIETAARLRRRDAPLCREMVRALAHGHAYDGSRAARELGLRYTPVEDTLRRTIEWLTSQGLLRPRRTRHARAR